MSMSMCAIYLLYLYLLRYNLYESCMLVLGVGQNWSWSWLEVVPCVPLCALCREVPTSGTTGWGVGLARND